MNLAQLAKKAAALPQEFEYSWPGPEHWHQDVFERNVKTLPEAIKYIDQMRERMSAREARKNARRK